MKKITLLIAIMITSLVFAQQTNNAPVPTIPTTNAPVPTKLAADVISFYSDAYTSLPGVDLNPNWGQTGFNAVNTTFNPTGATTNPNYAYFLDTFNYQGIQFTGQNLVSSKMEKLHIDIWTPNCSSFEVYLIAPGPIEKQVTLTPTLSGWNSYDIALTEYSNQNLPLTNIFQFKFVGTPFGTSKVYLDNIYFWKTPAPSGTPVIGSLTVPAKKVGDAPFILTDPTSNSSGAFSYTSSNTAVATISGKTVTIIGSGSSVITAIQAASPPYLTGSVTATLVVEAFPASAAPTPPNRPAADVISLFSDAYTNIPVAQWSAEWDDSNISDVTIDGNATKKINFGNFIGVILTDYTNTTAMTHFHMDYYINTGTDLIGKVLNPKLSNHAAKAGETNALLLTNLPALDAAGRWVSLDVPLSTFTPQGGGVAFSRESIKEFLITSNIGVVYVDNIYLHKNTLGTQKLDASNVKIYPNPVKNSFTISANSEIQRVSVRNILGQEVLKSNPKSNTATLQTSALQKGVYMVTTEIDGKLSTSKIIKE